MARVLKYIYRSYQLNNHGILLEQKIYFLKFKWHLQRKLCELINLFINIIY